MLRKRQSEHHDREQVQFAQMNQLRLLWLVDRVYDSYNTLLRFDNGYLNRHIHPIDHFPAVRAFRADHMRHFAYDSEMIAYRIAVGMMAERRVGPSLAPRLVRRPLVS